MQSLPKTKLALERNRSCCVVPIDRPHARCVRTSQPGRFRFKPPSHPPKTQQRQCRPPPTSLAALLDPDPSPIKPLHQKLSDRYRSEHSRHAQSRGGRAPTMSDVEVGLSGSALWEPVGWSRALLSRCRSVLREGSLRNQVSVEWEEEGGLGGSGD